MFSLRNVVTVCVIVLGVLSVRSRESQTQPQQRMPLSECIRLALETSHLKLADEHSIRAAEARLTQAISGRYPSLDLTAAGMVSDEDVNYIFPAFGVQTPPFNLGVIPVPPLNIGIPQQETKMADRRRALTEFSLIWPLYTGGKISAFVDQAKSGIAVAQCESRINNDRIVYETKKLYYSVILASNLQNIAGETHDILSSTLKLTETLYQKGSGKIMKTDYLKNKVYVEMARGLLDQISAERENAVTALAVIMGFEHHSKITLADEEIPFQITEQPLDSLIYRMNEKNPQIARVGFALNFYRAKIQEVKSSRFPSVALIGGYNHLFSPYDYGLTTPQNKDSWTMGLGMRINLFDGFRRRGLLQENREIVERIADQRQLLRTGLELNLRCLYRKIQAAALREKSVQEALAAAVDNSHLVERAYVSEIMELKDLLQARITEAVIKAQVQMVRFELADLQAQLDMLLGDQVETP